MELTIIAIVALGVLIFAAFLVVWLVDARRAEQIEHDPERLDTDTADTESDTGSADMPQELPGWRRPPL